MLSASPTLIAAEQGGGSGVTGLLLLVAVMVFAYFILVRPQRNRVKQLAKTQASLTHGAEVMTTAGLFATVVDFDDDTVTLETAPGVHSRYVRAAIAKIITPVEESDEDADGEVDDDVDDEVDYETVDESYDDADELAVDDDGETTKDASKPER